MSGIDSCVERGASVKPSTLVQLEMPSPTKVDAKNVHKLRIGNFVFMVKNFRWVKNNFLG
jgi:hypothetical protein